MKKNTRPLMLSRMAQGVLGAMVVISICTSPVTMAIDLGSTIQIVADLKLSGNEIYPLRINRNSEVLAPFDLADGGGTLLVYSPRQGISVTAVPEDRRVTSYQFSNWGAVLSTDARGGLPIRIAAVQRHQPWQVIFDAGQQGTAGGVTVNDQGVTAFVARQTNHHGDRDAYIWHPAVGLVPLPDLKEESLGAVPLVDGLGGVALPHLFLEPDYRFDIYQFTLQTGWSLKLPFSRLLIDNSTAGWSVNAAGNLVVPSNNGMGRHFLNYFEPDSETVVELVETTRQVGETVVADRVETFLADNGDMLLTIGQLEPHHPLRAEVRRANGTRTALDSLLPESHEFPFRAELEMNNQGELWFETVQTESGAYSYFFWDGTNLVPVLSDLSNRIQFPVLSDDRHAYFWLDDGSGAFDLVTVAVPEPSSVVLLMVACWMFRFRGAEHAGVGLR